VVDLTDRQLKRYARQLILPEIDLAGQQRLLASRVLIVGAGGLGVPMAQYLTGAGVGHVRIADDDLIELSNLPRQVAFSEQDVGEPKASVLCRQLGDLNSDTELDAKLIRFNRDSAQSLLQDVDLVLDATDSLRARLDIDRETYAAGLPWIMGTAVRRYGQWVAFDAERSRGCYHCLASNADVGDEAGCAQLGILGPVVALVSLQQSLLALRYLLGHTVSWGCIHNLDAWDAQLTQVVTAKRDDCPVCGGVSG